MKKTTYTVMILVLIVLISGCQGETELVIGKYLLDGNSENYTYVLLDKEGDFEFSRGIALSYLPSGTYEVEGDQLVLKANEQDYLFVIKDEELIFQNEIQGILERGSRFKLEETKK